VIKARVRGFRAGGRALTRRARQQDADGGFTLVEVVAAIAIFAMVSTATISILVTSIRTIKSNYDRVTAANIARSEIDRLRHLGPGAITLGLTNRTVYAPSDPRPFTVTTTTGWLGAGQALSACDAVAANAVAGQDYMRVHVEVIGGNLTAPERSDTLVAPQDDTSAATVGAIVAKVTNELNTPVEGVTVTGTNGQSTFSTTAITGADGCVMIPNLSYAPAAWTVTVQRAGYVPQTTNGNVKAATVAQGTVTQVPFLLAASSTLVFSSANGTYPIPNGLPMSFGPDALAIVATPVASYPHTIANLWPATNGYLAWLGTCLDADPKSAAAPRTTSVDRTWYTSPPGSLASAPLTGVAVRVRGLNANSTVTITHALEATGNCRTSVTYPIGKTDSLGVLRVLLPYGKWTVNSSGTPSIQVTLDPSAPAKTVNFPVASLDVVCPTPSPTATPTPTPTATATATPSATPSPCVTPTS
jgi:prepilin-type N-terminal cleavage/methylation domain-containing protein